jgi:HTH-type transcriptional regulator, sugar sensing transcriptional regulator
MSGNIPQEVFSALKEFGLTDYESRAFIALITNGISSAKDLSDRTKIPYSRIYDVLVNLENLGWVKVISGRPMQYKAERPAFVAKLAKKQIEEKYQRIEAALLEKLEPLYGHEETVESTPIWIINGNVQQKITDMIHNATKSINIFFKNPNETLLNDFFEPLLALNSKKVDIYLIIDEKNLNIKNKNIWRKLMSIAKIQTAKNVMFDGMMFDNTEMIIFLNTFFNVTVKEENMVFLISEQRLLNYTKNYFKMLWSLGTKFSLRGGDESSAEVPSTH